MITIPKIDETVRKRLELPPVTQLGMVVQDIEKTIRYYSDWFGVGPWEVVTPELVNQTYKGQPSDFRLQMAFAEHGGLQWELIKVLKGPTIYEECLGENGQGLHHVRCRVDNVDERIAAFNKAGFELVFSGQRTDVKSKFAYFDTRPIGGLIIEMTQRPYPLP